MNAPIVYAIPPDNNHINPWIEMASSILGINTIHSQPIKVYMIDDTHFGHVTQNILKMIPNNAIAHIAASRMYPTEFFKAIKHTGVYVPAINIKIAE